MATATKQQHLASGLGAWRLGKKHHWCDESSMLNEALHNLGERTLSCHPRAMIPKASLLLRNSRAFCAVEFIE